MLDVVLNLLFGDNVPTLTANENCLVLATACILIILCFSYISVSLFKLFKYIVKF